MAMIMSKRNLYIFNSEETGSFAVLLVTFKRELLLRFSVAALRLGK